MRWDVSFLITLLEKSINLKIPKICIYIYAKATVMMLFPWLLLGGVPRKPGDQLRGVAWAPARGPETPDFSIEVSLGGSQRWKPKQQQQQQQQQRQQPTGWWQLKHFGNFHPENWGRWTKFDLCPPTIRWWFRTNILGIFTYRKVGGRWWTPPIWCVWKGPHQLVERLVNLLLYDKFI